MNKVTEKIVSSIKPESKLNSMLALFLMHGLSRTDIKVLKEIVFSDAISSSVVASKLCMPLNQIGNVMLKLEAWKLIERDKAESPYAVKALPYTKSAYKEFARGA